MSLATGDWAHFWSMAALPGIGGVLLFAGAFRYLRRSRFITDTPTSRIRSAAQGYVELEGRARMMDGPPVICPLTAHRCVWWRYRIEVRGSGKRSRWRTVASDTSDALFELEDETGRCVVDPEGAKVVPGETHVWYGRSEWPERGPRAGGGLLDALLGGPYRYREELLKADAPLYALGDFRTQSAPHADTESQVRALIAEWKQDQEKLHERFDTNADGIIDEVEWEAARRVARMRVRREQAAAPHTPGLNVLSRGHHGHPFLLSARSQQRLARYYRYSAAACFAGFLVAGVVLLWMLGERGIL